MAHDSTLQVSGDWGMGVAHSERVSMQEARVVVVKGPHKGLKVPFSQDLFHIGRADWCDIKLDDDPWVSSHHCELRWTPKGIYVRDIGSSNGIALRDIRVFEAICPPKTPLRVGKSVLEIHTTSKTRDVELAFHDPSHKLVGRSPSMRRIFHLLSRLQGKDISLLLLGETGTGKSTIAHAFHEQSSRANHPFVVVNCGAFAPSLMEASLFGYEKGAFTGADQLHRGYFEQAHKGTLFLDEIGELPLELQPRLLDVIERKKLRRLGSEKEIDIDIRLIAATHKDLLRDVEEGRFREDLYYRIAVVDIIVPSLRERMEDLPLLLDQLLNQLSPIKLLRPTPDALEKLRRYVWPGNIRQLRNVLNRALALCECEITPEDLVLHQSTASFKADKETGQDTQTSQPARESIFPDDWWEQDMALKEILALSEKALLLETLNRVNWNVTKASKKLQISRAWLYDRIKKHELSAPSYDG